MNCMYIVSSYTKRDTVYITKAQHLCNCNLNIPRLITGDSVLYNYINTHQTAEHILEGIDHC
jgi:hypothetical protein